MPFKKNENSNLENGRLRKSITCFSFNKSLTEVALSPNDNSILIYSFPNIETSIDKWKLSHELIKHDSYVSGIDWSPVTNKIVSSGHDRSAYVWTYNSKNNEWEPTLVILRIDRAANCVAWTLNGSKFAVGSSAKFAPVCHYEVSNNWWISKMIKKLKSAVLTVAWHPNNKFLMTGGCDYKCRIFSAFIKECDSEDDDYDLNFPKANKFGVILAEFDCAKSWVEDVCFSPNGLQGAFVSHDSKICFFYIDKSDLENIKTSCINLSNLPFRQVKFLNNTAVVAAGHDCNPYLFVNKGNENEMNWELQEKLDKESNAKNQLTTKKVSAFAANKALFQSSTTKGISNKNTALTETTLKTKHQNQITQLEVLFGSIEDQSCEKFCSSGIDGRILLWDLKKLGVKL